MYIQVEQNQIEIFQFEYLTNSETMMKMVGISNQKPLHLFDFCLLSILKSRFIHPVEE